MKNTPTTQKTEVVLAKGKSLLGITAKILSGSKALATQTSGNLIMGGLMWEDVTNLEDSWMYWDDAIEYAKNLRQGGYDDWRLPSLDELKAAVRACGGINVEWGYGQGNIDNEAYKACCKAKGFVASNEYWSSTSDANYSHYAWVVGFYDGSQDSSNKCHGYYVRCVRAGQ